MTFRHLQKSCRNKRREIPGTVTEAVEMADKLVKQVCESGAQVAKYASSVAQPAVETEIVSLSTNLKKTREESFSAKA